MNKEDIDFYAFLTSLIAAVLTVFFSWYNLKQAQRNSKESGGLQRQLKDLTEKRAELHSAQKELQELQTELQKSQNLIALKRANLQELQPVFVWNDAILGLFEIIGSDKDDRVNKITVNPQIIIKKCDSVLIKNKLTIASLSPENRSKVQSCFDEVGLHLNRIRVLYLTSIQTKWIGFDELIKIRSDCIDSMIRMRSLLIG